MKVVRVLRCLACGKKYRRTQDSADTPAPCPDCAVMEAPPPLRIAAPAIVGAKSRAVDEAWKVAQEDYGFTDMRDNLKEGEAAFKPPPPPPSNVNPATITRPTMLWGGGNGSSLVQAPSLAQARAGAYLANAEGKNPMKLLHAAHPRLRALPLNKGS